MIWSIDGVEWNIPCQVIRTAEIKSTDISGMMMNGVWYNDVIGTYMQYEVAIAVPITMRDEYYAVYEILTQPVPYHEFILPYNAEVVTFNGRIESISDEYVYMGEDNNWWKGVRFTVISSTPSKVATADGIINYGLPQIPYAIDPEIGDYYQFTASGWVLADVYEADEVAY